MAQNNAPPVKIRERQTFRPGGFANAHKPSATQERVRALSVGEEVPAEAEIVAPETDVTEWYPVEGGE